ncbi:MAG TPA: leucyl aminopeptidase [Bryobacteraceae bacterium]|nr:leucyl aminopeptidase [Bryobacteraceae bacterium]
MQIQLDQGPVEALECDALVVLTFDGKPNERFKDALSEVYGSGEITGKIFEMTLVHRPAGVKAKRLLVAGGGAPEKFTSAELRRVASAALRHLKAKSLKSIALALEPGFATAEHVTAAAEGALLGDYEPDRYKSDKKDVKTVDRFIVSAPGGKGLDAALGRGRTIAEAQNLTRELVNEPANKLTPTYLAECAAQMATAQGLECEVLDRGRMQQLGMGSLLGVAQGSAEPPALIVLRYKPSGKANGAAHLGLVGKGVTFDTGGISIKPADGMEKMKYDMAGGAAMIGAMRALAQLKPAIPVTALIPAVENMPGSRAQRPGDIVTALSGKTIEVINTDAEGRLILADALTYARRLGCTHLVDAATLTGSVVVALGHINVGLFSNDDRMAERVLEASRVAGEKMWRMPLDDDYKDQLKSAFADIANVGGRPGGAITASLFLREFAEQTPWVHLDIAGTAWLDDAKPYMAKGPSGVGVRTFVNLAMNWRD